MFLPSGTTPSSQPSCLIVDDELDLTRVLSRHVDELGLESTVAGSLADARSVFNDRPWDVAVIDVVLPDGDGRDLIPELRSLPHAPVVVLTSVLSRYDLAGHDADAYLAKPFRKNDVKRAFAMAIGNAARSNQPNSE